MPHVYPTQVHSQVLLSMEQHPIWGVSLTMTQGPHFEETMLLVELEKQLQETLVPHHLRQVHPRQLPYQPKPFLLQWHSLKRSITLGSTSLYFSCLTTLPM
uniref:Uncharacterized protein n=1 Tax=Arundo donax TaxID=35708 RepID=A0A0A9DEE2_ARUDO